MPAVLGSQLPVFVMSQVPNSPGSSPLDEQRRFPSTPTDATGVESGLGYSYLEPITALDESLLQASMLLCSQEAVYGAHQRSGRLTASKQHIITRAPAVLDALRTYGLSALGAAR